jgi:hypothetical protein
MFNALRYTEELERAGFSRSQAETSVKMLIDLMNENFATKNDLGELGSDMNTMLIAIRSDMNAMEQSLRSDVNAMEQSLRSDMNAMEQSLRSDMRELEYKLTIKLGTLMTIAIGVTATLVKLIPSHG